MGETKKSSVTTDLPMKWYKFLIYFGLWFGAALLVIQGVGYITGAVYNDSSGVGAGTVYGAYPGMRLWDRIYGGAFVCLAAFEIVTRFALAKFKRIGPTLLYLVYGIQGGLALLSAIVVSVITGSNGVVFSVGSLIVAAALILLNRSYFKARQELFVN